MDGLERLAGNPVVDKGIKGILLCNPTSRAVTFRPSVPDAWFRMDAPDTERTMRASRMFYDNRSWGHEFPGAHHRDFGPVEIPASSWLSIPLAELPEPGPAVVTHTVEASQSERRELNFAATHNAVHATGRIESPFHVLTYDPPTGRILSLEDRRQGRELLAQRPGIDFLSFVRERTDALREASRGAFYQRDLDKEKYDLSCWVDWSPVRENARRVVSTSVDVHHDRVTLERVFAAPGMAHLVQRISLVADDPVIHIEMEMELESDSDPQGIYLALPLAMSAQWEAAFDTAGDLVRLDDDQLPGACRGWVTAESMAQMWDAESAVALFVPDAPGVQFGDFHFGPRLESVPRPADPLLLAWPVNNYWDTNFPLIQTGRISLRYGFMSVPTAERDDLRAHAEAFRQQPLVWPITSQGRDAGSGMMPGAR